MTLNKPPTLQNDVEAAERDEDEEIAAENEAERDAQEDMSSTARIGARKRKGSENGNTTER